MRTAGGWPSSSAPQQGTLHRRDDSMCEILPRSELFREGAHPLRSKGWETLRWCTLVLSSSDAETDEALLRAGLSLQDRGAKRGW